MSRLVLPAIMLLAVALPVGAEPPSPLDLVRGLRDHGMPDLAIEYLKEQEALPHSPEVKAAFLLELSKCRLDAAEDEADPGLRKGMVEEATKGFDKFIRDNPNHPRVAEASLALARLGLVEAKAQLSRASKLEVAEEGREGVSMDKKRAEMAAPRPLFIAAAKRFETAATQIEAQINQPGIDPLKKQNLERELYQARLAQATTQINIGETYFDANSTEMNDRAKQLNTAKELFKKMADGPANSRTSWVGAAWLGEINFQLGDPKIGEKTFNEVLAQANNPAAVDGIRLVKFFQIRRLITGKEDFVNAEKAARLYLAQYDKGRRPTAETLSVRFFLARLLHQQVEVAAAKLKPNSGSKHLEFPPAVKQQLNEAERLYRSLSQTENDYKDRAARERIRIVRLIIADADKAPSEYGTFEFCHMAALVQMSKIREIDSLMALIEEEKAPACLAALGGPVAGGKVAAHRGQVSRVIHLLERTRALATAKENAGDVADSLNLLLYFYRETQQFHQSAVLGESIALTSRGEKGALAGYYGVAGYAAAAELSQKAEGAPEDKDKRDAALKADRQRALNLALILDKKYPDEPATDQVRSIAAAYLYDDGKPEEAFAMISRVRPSAPQLIAARQYEASLAHQMLVSKSAPLPPDRKLKVYRQAVEDVAKVAKPPAAAKAADVVTYFKLRYRLALLYLIQSLCDPETEKTASGFVKADEVARELNKSITEYPELGTKVADGVKYTSAGWELHLLADDAWTRALNARAASLFNAGDYPKAFDTLAPVFADMAKGPVLDQVSKVDTGGDETLKGKLDALATGIDDLRKGMIVLGMKIRMKEGKADLAVQLIDLLKTYGGSIEKSIPTLQQLSGEMSAQIKTLRAEGKNGDADQLAEGFIKFLNKVSAEPNLPMKVQLFIGSSFYNVNKPVESVAVLRKVPNPGPELLSPPVAKPVDPKDPKAEVKKIELTPAQQEQVAVYRVATLYIIKALILDKKYKECEELINEITRPAPPPNKPGPPAGWAANSVDFRIQKALLHEARAKDEPAKAGTDWGLAMKEWSALFRVRQIAYDTAVKKNEAIRKAREEAEKKNDKPKDEAEIQAGEILKLKNTMIEAMFETHRCILEANTQLKKKLPETYAAVVKTMVDTETRFGADIIPDIRAKYFGLLEKYPELKKGYVAAGGKLFLQKE